MNYLVIVLMAALAAACTESPTAPDPITSATPMLMQDSHDSGPSYGGHPVTAYLTGNEVVDGGGGDPNGYGHVSLSYSNGREKLCFVLVYYEIDPPTGLHIHFGAAGVRHNGAAPVADFTTPDYGTHSSGCTYLDDEVGKEMFQHPSDYFVEVETQLYPAGAIRGQLRK
jgi:hypothetical protein